LASLPPELDVPLPLEFDFTALPVVGDDPGVAELAAGSPVTAPRPLAPLDCAKAVPAQSMTAATTAGFINFMADPSLSDLKPATASGSLNFGPGRRDFAMQNSSS